MAKETGTIFEEHIGDKDLHSEKWLEWVLNSFKQLDSSDYADFEKHSLEPSL